MYYVIIPMYIEECWVIQIYSCEVSETYIKLIVKFCLTLF